MDICNKKDKTRFFLYIAAAILAFIITFLVAGIGAKEVHADQISPYFSSTDGSPCTDISDGDYFTTEYFDPGTQITLSSDLPMDSLYIVWEEIPGEWTLQIDGTSYTYGKEGYLHEYIQLPGSPTSVTICVGEKRLILADVYAFSAGPLPDFVQIWEEPYEEADILLISTHADDEVLFFGGIIPNYVDQGDLRIQVAYFSDLFQTEPYRNHEILNGLWHMGLTHYPQLGEFYDHYSESYEEAVEQFDYNQSLEYIVKTIRRFKPQVLIGQDPENGEYGHGGHMWCARIIEDALEITDNPESYPESATQYGTWDVPKTYFHLYPENTIELDARQPLASFGGKTELEIAKEAYLEHQSQQWCWFYVSDGYDEDGNPDGYEYSCTRYGLYRTLVGADTGNDLMENIVSYNEQERRAAKAEEESKAAEEAALAAAQAEAEAAVSEGTATAQSVLEENNPVAVPGGKNTTAITILIIIAVIILLIMVGIIVVTHSRAKVREQQRQNERRRREQEARARGRYSSSVNRSSSGYRSTASGDVRQVYGGSSRSVQTGSVSTGSRSSNGAYRSTGNRNYSGTYRTDNSRNSNGTYQSGNGRDSYGTYQSGNGRDPYGNNRP